MQRFYWVLEGIAAGCSLPGGPARGGGVKPDPQGLVSDLALLRQRGIRAVLSLTEDPLPADALAATELVVLHLPVPDLHAPTPDQLDQAIRFIDEQSALGHATAVHCLMGQGRTGTVLAAYLIRNGLTAAEALAEIRHLCDGAISAPEQEAALRTFASRRAWVV